MKPGVWILFVTCAVAGVDGLLFGYDTGVISGVLVTISNDLGTFLTDGQKEIITAITSVGAVVSALFSGLVADAFGRKSVMWFSTIAFTGGAVLQAFSYTYSMLVTGRFVVGLGVGAASMVAPMYIAELAPARYRGRLVVIDVLCITGGQVVAYLLGAAFEGTAGGWRYMTGLGAVPSVILICLLPFLPESPRYLIIKHKTDDASAVISKLFPRATREQVALEVDNLTTDMSDNIHSYSLPLRQRIAILLTTPSNLRALVVACGLMAIQQLCGMNTLMYYSATLFQMVGFTKPILVGVSVAGTNFLFTCISLVCIDTVGRRKILVWSMWGMPLGLILASIGFLYLPKTASGEILSGAPVGWSAVLVLTSLLVFIAAYATGLGNVPWQSTEFFPTELRGIGTTLLTLFNWAPNILVSSTFLSLMRALTPSGAFLVYAVVCFVGWIGVIKCFPECAGLSLEEIRLVFQDGFGIEKAEELRSEKAGREKEEMKEW